MSHLSGKLSTVFVIGIALVAIPFHSALAFSGPGSGTSDDPYIIANCVQLQEMSNDLTASYKLAGNINCADTANWNNTSGFAAIGDADTPFTGSLDGASHTILDLYINQPTADDQGLFGYVQGGTIANVTVAGNVTGQNNTGGLIGYASQETITNDHSTVTVTGSQATGGLIGDLVPDDVGTVSGNSFSGTVLGNTYAGGLVGVTTGTIIDEVHIMVQDSYSTGTVNGSEGVGGLIGFVSNGGVIEDSYSQSNINTPDGPEGIGGLIGLAGGATIQRTYASGNLNVGAPMAPTNVGGLVGGIMLASGNESIIDSFSIVHGSTSDVHGVYGGVETAGEDDETLTMTNDYYNATNVPSGICDEGSGQNDTGCTGIAVDDSTYWQDSGNDPLSQWSDSIWDIGTYALPVLTGNYVVPDTTPPTVLSVSPANSATNVDGNAPIVITFSEPMDTASLVVSTSGCTGDGCPSYDEAWSSNDSVVTLTQQNNGLFQPDTTYDFEIYSAKDVAQNAIASPYDLSFTTGDGPVLTETTAIPSSVLAENAIYHFTTSETCSILAQEVQGPGQVEFLVHPDPVPDEDITAYFNNLETGGTYSTSFKCVDDNGLTSNTLTIGPFTVLPDPGLLSGGNPTVTWTPETGTVTHAATPAVAPIAVSVTTPVSTVALSRLLRQGMSGPDVKVLQQYLNVHKFVIASSGAGSPGHETSLFGALTKKAVINFQKAHGLTADGIVGPKTRALMI